MHGSQFGEAGLSMDAEKSGNRRPQIAVISAHYYERHLACSLKQLQSLRTLLDASRCVVVSNNPAFATPLQEAKTRNSFIDDVVLHDNGGLEFGAYQAGLNSLCRTSDPDWVVVLNDTLATHHCFSSPTRANFVRHLIAPGLADFPIVVGQVESLARSYALHGMRTHRWITTNVFALNRAALQRLDHRIHIPDLDRLVESSGDRAHFFADDMDSILREHLDRWLFEPNGANSWYGAAPLDSGNAAKFAGKARSIIQEKFLSARLDSIGTMFVDIKRLSRTDRLWNRAEEQWFALWSRN